LLRKRGRCGERGDGCSEKEFFHGTFRLM